MSDPKNQAKEKRQGEKKQDQHPKSDVLDSIATIKTSFVETREFQSYYEEEMNMSMIPKTTSEVIKRDEKIAERISEEGNSLSEKSLQKGSSGKNSKDSQEKKDLHHISSFDEHRDIAHNNQEETLANIITQLEGNRNILQEQNNDFESDVIEEESEEENQIPQEVSPKKNKSYSNQGQKEIALSFNSKSRSCLGTLLLVLSLVFNLLFFISAFADHKEEFSSPNPDTIKQMEEGRDRMAQQLADVESKKENPVRATTSCVETDSENILLENEKLKIQIQNLENQMKSLQSNEKELLKTIENYKNNEAKFEEKIKSIISKINDRINLLHYVQSPCDAFADNIKSFLNLIKELFNQ